jgi:uroporphyrinogen-III decarboxylase
MNARDRFLRVLDGEIPDRVPVTAWLDEIYLTHYLNREVEDLITDSMEIYRSFGFDIVLRIFWEEVDSWTTEDWSLETQIVTREGNRRKIKTIETPGGELREVVALKEVQPGLHVSHTEEYLVKTKKDLRLMERYEVIRPPIKTEKIKRAMDTIGDDGIVVTYGGGGAHTGAALYLRGLERLTLDAYKDPAFYEGLLNWAIEYERGVLDVLEQIQPDLCQIGGLLAQGNYVGPKFYRDHILTYDRRYIEEVHKRGLRTVYHNCGFSRNLLELYGELGTDAFESFPPQPTADGDIAYVKEVLGGDTVLFGNIDNVHLLREGSPDEVAEAVKQTILVGKEGGKFVLSTADEVFPDTPVENLEAMARAALDHGRYA